MEHEYLKLEEISSPGSSAMSRYWERTRDFWYSDASSTLRFEIGFAVGTLPRALPKQSAFWFWSKLMREYREAFAKRP